MAARPVHNALLLLAVFLACSVEAVEALTIVLAVGVTRGWRSALQGVVAGVLVLAVIVLVFGPAVSRIPIDWLRVVVGAVLLIFGVGWLRKAILRASGYKSLHDEAAIYQRELAAARTVQEDRRPLVGDWYAFTLSFKGVVLEGLEVAFIVVTFGANQGDVGLAGLAALAAVAVVIVAGLLVRAPLARVPENTMKFIVGVLLTSFGIFWGGEGAGSGWPGGDVALPVVIAFVALVALGLTAALQRIRAAELSDLTAAGR